jgi:LysM domain
MTLIHAMPSRPGTVPRPIYRPIARPRCDRDMPARSRRPAPSRPAGTPAQYRGGGVAMSVAPHRRRPVTLATTAGLALLAGMITLWLGVVAHFGQIANDGSGSHAQVPDRLGVVRVEAGESLQDVAARVAPDAPVRQVTERIRELNALNSPGLVAGQTLIAPVG